MLVIKETLCLQIKQNNMLFECLNYFQFIINCTFQDYCDYCSERLINFNRLKQFCAWFKKFN